MKTVTYGKNKTQNCAAAQVRRVDPDRWAEQNRTEPELIQTEDLEEL